MKRFLSIKILALALVTLLGNIPVIAAERAFSASGRGVLAFILDGNGNPVGADITGSGLGTHLGMFSSSGRLYIEPDPNKPTIVLVSGEATFLAANGDKLHIVVENGSMDVTTGIGSGNFRFTGGTGRFENATGLLSYVVDQSLVTGAYEITMVGKINY